MLYTAMIFLLNIQRLDIFLKIKRVPLAKYINLLFSKDIPRVNIYFGIKKNAGRSASAFIIIAVNIGSGL
jgi:hypothetical protein